MLRPTFAYERPLRDIQGCAPPRWLEHFRALARDIGIAKPLSTPGEPSFSDWRTCTNTVERKKRVTSVPVCGLFGAMFLRVIYRSAQRLYLLLRQSLMGGKNGLHSCFRVDQSEPVKRAIPEFQRSILKSATLTVSGEALLRFLN